jgi:hypothetical protein
MKLDYLQKQIVVCACYYMVVEHPLAYQLCVVYQMTRRTGMADRREYRSNTYPEAGHDDYDEVVNTRKV